MSLGNFLWPLQCLDNGARPVISDGFKTVAIPGVQRQHLGADLMFPNTEGVAASPPDFTKGFACPTGVGIVLAAGDGTVNTVDLADKHGVFVLIDHGNDDGGPWSTGYRHLASCNVKVGDSVAAGQPIGIAGKDLAAGPKTPNHLHFEVWDRSRERAEGQGPRAAYSVDPEPFLQNWKVKTSNGFSSPDISPSGNEDAGETASNLTTVLMVDVSSIHHGALALL